MTPIATVLSPHFDDAVLSCWHLLAGPGEVEVINVFAGAPPSGSPVGWWDLMTGSCDSTRRVSQRVAEDREALALAGRKPVNLELLDEQYRNGRRPGSLTGAVEARLDPGARIYVPAGLVRAGDDHILTRAAGLELARRGFEVSLYVDIPHALEFGWPAWVTGEPQPLAVDAGWERSLAEAGVPVERLQPEVHELGAEARERKLEAIRAYRSQLPALEAMFGGLDTERLRYEVTWALGGG